jgi:hypothetical protein
MCYRFLTTCARDPIFPVDIEWNEKIPDDNLIRAFKKKRKGKLRSDTYGSNVPEIGSTVLPTTTLTLVKVTDPVWGGGQLADAETLKVKTVWPLLTVRVAGVPATAWWPGGRFWPLFVHWVIASDSSFALTVLILPNPAILPLQVRVFVDVPEPLVLHVGVPTKCEAAARTGAATKDIERVSAARSVGVIIIDFREVIEIS